MPTRLVCLPLALAAVAVALAGCATAPPVPDEPSADGTTYRLVAEAPGAIAVGVVMVGADFLSGSVAAAELVMIAPDVFAGEFVLVDGDGAFSVPLPAAADIPAATMVPLADAVLNFGACTIDAAPLAAEASVTISDGLTIPGLLALTSEGTALMYATDAELEEGTMGFEGTANGWIFVDRDAQLSVSGCAYEADLMLSEGWNQLAWTAAGATTLVEVVPAANVFAAVAIPFPRSVVPLSRDGAE